MRAAFEAFYVPLLMGRPFVTSPGVPKERVRILQQAFMKTLQDPEFLEEAGKLKLEINPVSGEELEKVVARVKATPEKVIQELKEALGPLIPK